MRAGQEGGEVVQAGCPRNQHLGASPSAPLLRQEVLFSAAKAFAPSIKMSVIDGSIHKLTGAECEIIFLPSSPCCKATFKSETNCCKKAL